MSSMEILQLRARLALLEQMEREIAETDRKLNRAMVSLLLQEKEWTHEIFTGGHNTLRPDRRHVGT